MSSPPLRTAIIAPIELPAELERIRLAEDPMAQLGVPAHVTLLFPFMPPEAVNADVARVLRGVIGAHRGFETELATVRRFPSNDGSNDGSTDGSNDAVLWLAPEPATPFIRLTESLVAAFPEYQPYGGAHDAVVPHLTIATLAGTRSDALEREAARHLPVRREVAVATLVTEGSDGRWRERERFPLG